MSNDVDEIQWEVFISEGARDDDAPTWASFSAASDAPGAILARKALEHLGKSRQEACTLMKQTTVSGNAKGYMFKLQEGENKIWFQIVPMGSGEF